MSVEKNSDLMYSVETHVINNDLSISIAYDKYKTDKPGNGGFRFYQYPNRNDHESEALTLARHMTQKHEIYNTGFSGIKVVANGALTQENKRLALDKLGYLLNKFEGKIYTGCDLNTNDDDMLYLKTISPYILNAMDAPQMNTSIATAYGVYGSLMAVMDHNGDRHKKKKIFINGVGKIGATIAAELIRENYIVYTYDINEKNADIPGCINVSHKQDWYKTECDYLVLCSISNIITDNNVDDLNCRWIVSSANSPFSSKNVVDTLDKNNIGWIPDVISNAGAVICDAIEFSDPEKYKNLSPSSIYDCVYKRIYQKTHHVLRLSVLHQITPQDVLNIFLSIHENRSLNEIL